MADIEALFAKLEKLEQSKSSTELLIREKVKPNKSLIDRIANRIAELYYRARWIESPIVKLQKSLARDEKKLVCARDDLDLEIGNCIGLYPLEGIDFYTEDNWTFTQAYFLYPRGEKSYVAKYGSSFIEAMLYNNTKYTPELAINSQALFSMRRGDVPLLCLPTDFPIRVHRGNLGVTKYTIAQALPPPLPQRFSLNHLSKARSVK
ncbi:hypothetical protein KKE03_05090 [Patescibacteria group bacterium]|nr:hypothetical protein [Patescibacteria group bacterium]